jgi:8-oxo-dGTP pyrophosphatase MutT (NUDIX family)
MSADARKARNSRLIAVQPTTRTRQASVPFVRLSHLRRLCECEQVAAVCYRVRSGAIEFLLVRTRGGGRWTFPKGSAEPGLTHAQAAALEAFEEAGVHGRIEEASFARYRRKRGDGENRASRRDEKRVAVNAYLCEVLRLSSPQESRRDRTWFSVEQARRRLRDGRQSDGGAEFVRVVDRAVARIQQLRGKIGMVDDLPQDDRPLQDRPLQKDAIQKVQFEAVAQGYGAGPVRQFAPYVQRRLSETRLSIAPDVEVHGREILHCEVLEFGAPRDAKAKALGSGAKNG